MKKKQKLALPPFDWSISPEQIYIDSELIIKETRDLHDRISSLSDNQLSFQNCIAPLIAPPNYKTNPRLCNIKFLQHCSTDPKVREAALEAGTKFRKERVTNKLRADVYNRILEYSKKKENLTPYQNHFVQSLLKLYQKSGLGLPEESQKKLRSLLAKDADLCADYNKVIADEKTRIFFGENELLGLDKIYIDSHKDKDSNKVIVTLKYPDILPIFNRCSVESTRKKMWITRDRDSYKGNIELMREASQVRKDIATILGYSDYAEYILSDRMAASSNNVYSFLSNLESKLQKQASLELKRLHDLKKLHCEENDAFYDGMINPWDLSFYHNLLLKRDYSIDLNEIKSYFPLDKVVKVTMEIYQEILGLQFNEIFDFSKWHSSVRLFSVNDSKTQELIGNFYLDLHPREGKYTHAAIFHLLKRTPTQVPCACMLANLPEKYGDVPALLPHGEVETFFHEFGHLMHDVCSEGDYNNTTLAKCPRDFVEAPSQMLENWCWKMDVLQRLSSHYITKKPLPESLLNKLIQTKNVNTSLFTLRQIFLSTLDMKIHLRSYDTKDDILNMEDDIRRRISLIPNYKGCSMLGHFGHLMGQYAAGYYGYLWSKVISSDMFFERFDNEGIFNSMTGREYRKKILSPGGVGIISTFVSEFLGREPNQDHFLKDSGISVE